MKTIKYIVIIAISLMSLNGFAQEGKNEDILKLAETHVSNWAKYIPGVTDDQQKQMVGIENWFITLSKEVQENTTDTDAALAKVKKLSDERNHKIEMVLSSTQYNRYMQIYAEQAK